MKTGKKVNKHYIKAEEGIGTAIAFHDKYHNRSVEFKYCNDQPCRLVANPREFYGAFDG